MKTWRKKFFYVTWPVSLIWCFVFSVGMFGILGGGAWLLYLASTGEARQPVVWIGLFAVLAWTVFVAYARVETQIVIREDRAMVVRKKCIGRVPLSQTVYPVAVYNRLVLDYIVAPGHEKDPDPIQLLRLRLLDERDDGLVVEMTGDDTKGRLLAEHIGAMLQAPIVDRTFAIADTVAAESRACPSARSFCRILRELGDIPPWPESPPDGLIVSRYDDDVLQAEVPPQRFIAFNTIVAMAGCLFCLGAYGIGIHMAQWPMPCMALGWIAFCVLSGFGLSLVFVILYYFKKAALHEFMSVSASGVELRHRILGFERVMRYASEDLMIVTQVESQLHFTDRSVGCYFGENLNDEQAEWLYRATVYILARWG